MYKLHPRRIWYNIYYWFDIKLKQLGLRWFPVAGELIKCHGKFVFVASADIVKDTVKIVGGQECSVSGCVDKASWRTWPYLQNKKGYL